MKRTDRSTGSRSTYAIAAAALVTLAIAAHGQTIVAWGDNTLGQCNVSPLPPGVVYAQVEAGDFFTAARRSDGYVVVWGDNSLGQTAVPPLPAGVKYVQLSAGGAHLLARRSDGVVVAWGDNTDGQCNVPAFPAGLTCVQVAAGGHHSLARLSNGSLLAWGRNVEGQCNAPPGFGPWIDVDAGGYHTLVTDSSNHAYAFGLNTQGQSSTVYSGHVVAIAAGGSQSLVRRDYFYNDSVLAWGVPAGVPTGTISALAAGSGHSLFLKTDGTVIGIGLNNHGQCNAPVLPGSIYLDIAAGNGHSAAIVGPVPPPQSIVAWGNNSNGQCNVPPLPLGVVYAQVVAGDFFTAARRSDGSVVIWGDNFYGQTAVPSLPAGTTYVDLAAGAYHLLALRSDGAVVAWGANTSGQCNVPPFPAGVACVDVAAGGHHSLARLSNGSLMAWGLNAEGQCNVPALPAGVMWTSVDGGGFHTLATRSNGLVSAWGLNSQGQCNIGQPNPGNYAAAVAAGAYHSMILMGNGYLSPFGLYASAMAAGSGHSLYRRTDGTTLGFGLNDHGQCNVPPLQAGSIYINLAAGNGHSAALVGPVAGSTTSGVGCGGPGPNTPLLYASAPILGSTIAFNLSYATPNASGFLYASPPAAPTTVSPGCVVRVDLATAVPVMPVTTLPSGSGAPGFWVAYAPVPFVPALAGAQLALQIALLPTPTAFDLTNGVLITLGYDATGPSGLCCQ